MSRYAPSGVSYSFGPGAMTPAVRAILYANLAAFVATLLLPGLMIDLFGLRPEAFLQRGRLWQIVTYLFLHDPQSVMHILFNMLALWMFGVDLERRWGRTAFLRYYFVCGIGAGLTCLLVSLLPFGFAQQLHHSIVIGASGAIYGLLLAYGMYYPDRPIYMYLVFPIPARYFVMIMGALAFYSSIAERGGVANATHLGGLLVAYLFLKSGRVLRAQGG